MSEKQIEPVSKNITPEIAFKPNANQEKWLDTAMQLETDEIKAIGEACDIERTTWYQWLKIPGFIEWFEAEWNRRLLGHGWKLDVIGMKNAKKDHRYWESMQKRMGRIKETPSVVVPIQNNINVKKYLEQVDES